MINSRTENDSSAASSGNHNQSNNLRDAAGQAYSKASEMARDASDKVKQAASDTASTVTENVKELFDQQLGIGAGVAVAAALGIACQQRISRTTNL